MCIITTTDIYCIIASYLEERDNFRLVNRESYEIPNMIIYNMKVSDKVSNRDPNVIAIRPGLLLYIDNAGLIERICENLPNTKKVMRMIVICNRDPIVYADGLLKNPNLDDESRHILEYMNGRPYNGPEGYDILVNAAKTNDYVLQKICCDDEFDMNDVKGYLEIGQRNVEHFMENTVAVKRMFDMCDNFQEYSKIAAKAYMRGYDPKTFPCPKFTMTDAEKTIYDIYRC